MITMDAFRADAFSAVSLTSAVDKLGFVPQYLGSIPGLFVPAPVRTTAVWIEERSNGPALIQTSPRSAPPDQKAGEQRTARAFNTKALGKGSRIMADELQNIRAFGSETEMKTLQTELARRQLLIKNDIELTMENWRLSVIQGKLLDADGTTIYDWNLEFGQAQASEINWDLLNTTPASGALRLLCNQVVRHITRKLQGVGGTNIKIMAACGDEFWDAFTAHPEVRQTYLNWMAAADLRTGNAWETFEFGNITWFNYRSTDDGDTSGTPTVGIPTTRAKFFPVGAGIFQMAYAPAPRMEFVNTLGQPTYSWIVLDEKRDMWADCETFSYPLAVCTMPGALQSGKRSSGD
jgi:major capsid protein E